MGIDETLERRQGKKISAKGIYRDPVRSSDGHFVKISALRWVCLALLAPVSWASRVWAQQEVTYCGSAQEIDMVGVPREFIERLTEAVCYAA